MKFINISVLLLLPGIACGPKVEPNIAANIQGDGRLIALGRNSLENNNRSDARSYFQQLLDSYPRSELAGDARLGIADTYFEDKGISNLILSIAEYRDFLTFFPNHPRADYAQYRVAYGHYRQVNSPDRDQEATQLAIVEFETLIRLYRNSQYAEEGRELLKECYETLAESEFRIGLFYLEVRKHCRASIPRFQTVLEKYPAFSKLDEVHFKIGTAFQQCKKPEDASEHFRNLIDKYPDSLYKLEAQDILTSLQTPAS